tara:strand:+ start:164 stop:406 length:243 start_codon:yes stop_codon:yes gene_type:complete
MKVNIEPVDVFPGTATQMEISAVSVGLGQGACCTYSLLNELDTVLKSDTAHLTAEQYEGWGNDDEYFVEAIAENIGITLI